jgi:branched-chain amino acid transport system substrate-binding protein
MVDFNPKLFYVALACAWPAFKAKFGPATEGVMGPGGWNEKYSPKAKEFYDKFLAMHGRPPCNWSTAFGYGTLQIYEQAIEKVGLKDREKLRDVIATSTFDTVYGPIKYTDYFNVDHPSYIGQWQKGTFESVAPKATRKVNPIYPKPPWPK